jgi:two-component sensor histidine kinase
VILDFGRATASGLIVNELITNSYKYAFPAAFDCMQERGSPCRIVVRFSLHDGTYLLSVSDNGIGLPAGYNPEAAQSLGLRLVNVLATHQLRAKVTTNTRNGTEFMFRFERSQH